MFEIKDLDILVGTRYLIKSLSLTLNKGDKLAIIGEEGNGKSTLLKSILGICEYGSISGSINFNNNKIGYLKQTLENNDLKKKVHGFLFIDDEDYYSKINDLYNYLEILKLGDDIFNQKMETLSGGEKIKVSILKILLENPDILFLDEPTNDLDIASLKWLELFINNTNKPIIYVSHDETLLSNTANMILHLEQIKHKTECRHTLLRTNYNDYVEKRLRLLSKQTQLAYSEKRNFNKKYEKLNQIMQKVEHLQNTISRSDPHGAQVLKKKIHTLKYQENKLNNEQLTHLPDVEEEINFFFEKVSISSTKKILKLKIPELKINNKLLSKNIELDIIGNNHICIIGDNGSGKTTLLKIIYNILKNRNDLKVGYMPQTYDDILLNYTRVLDFICPSNDKEEITKARMYLGNMKFTKEEMIGKVDNLSNGSKAKLFLMKLVLDKCNVLILDEPTRNVSPLSNPIIRKVLNDFDGVIISVSHDRKYIEEVALTLYLLDVNGLKKIEK